MNSQRSFWLESMQSENWTTWKRQRKNVTSFWDFLTQTDFVRLVLGFTLHFAFQSVSYCFEAIGTLQVTFCKVPRNERKVSYDLVTSPPLYKDVTTWQNHPWVSRHLPGTQRSWEKSFKIWWSSGFFQTLLSVLWFLVLLCCFFSTPPFSCYVRFLNNCFFSVCVVAFCIFVISSTVDAAWPCYDHIQSI